MGSRSSLVPNNPSRAFKKHQYGTIRVDLYPCRVTGDEYRHLPRSRLARIIFERVTNSFFNAQEVLVPTNVAGTIDQQQKVDVRQGQETHTRPQHGAKRVRSESTSTSDSGTLGHISDHDHSDGDSSIVKRDSFDGLRPTRLRKGQQQSGTRTRRSRDFGQSMRHNIGGTTTQKSPARKRRITSYDPDTDQEDAASTLRNDNLGDAIDTDNSQQDGSLDMSAAGRERSSSGLQNTIDPFLSRDNNAATEPEVDELQIQGFKGDKRPSFPSIDKASPSQDREELKPVIKLSRMTKRKRGRRNFIKKLMEKLKSYLKTDVSNGTQTMKYTEYLKDIKRMIESFENLCRNLDRRDEEEELFDEDLFQTEYECIQGTLSELKEELMSDQESTVWQTSARSGLRMLETLQEEFERYIKESRPQKLPLRHLPESEATIVTIDE
jgi:hypothetical protein